MKKLYIYTFLLFVAFNFVACDYLDIVPDEIDKEEDAYKDIEAARGYLYSCYGYMPTPNYTQESLDLMTGDEVVTAFEHETFAKFPQGNFTAGAPVISYWNDLFSGIRQCYKFRNVLDKVPGLDAATKQEYIGETDFLIGYYHMLLMRCYGPIIIVREEIDINTNPNDYQGRESLDACVQFITQKFDDAVPNLPATRSGKYVGRATSVAAKALKAYTLMYYASPLFNGNQELASQLKNIDGADLLSATYDAERWVNAKNAYLDAITAAETAGHALYTEENPKMENIYPRNDTLRVLRANEITAIKYNKEEIWTKYHDEDAYGLQKKSMPYVDEVNYNGVAPTLAMLQRFYTRNGLPYDVDPETKDKNEFDVVSLTENNAIVEFVGGSRDTIAEIGQKTSQINLNREPRYYAWIAFHNGFYEVTNASENGGFSPDRYPQYYESSRKYKGYKIITDFLKNGNCGRNRTTQKNYSPTGFLNKKGVHPDNEISNNNATWKKYPFPLIRLAELYLGYAECAAECGDVSEAKKYVNKVRERAGIPDVDTSWRKVGITPDAAKMVEIVRQERQIELYLECQNFWDMRRWKLAKKYFDVQPEGMNVDGEDVVTFSQKFAVPVVRNFRDYHWLLPIPSKDVDNNHNLVQNPGY